MCRILKGVHVTLSEPSFPNAHPSNSGLYRNEYFSDWLTTKAFWYFNLRLPDHDLKTLVLEWLFFSQKSKLDEKKTEMR
eukprot:g65812.t1